MTSKSIQLKRVYEPVTPNDGMRILVERLWPRGLTKDKAQVDYWAKDIAPSTDLRKWYDHQIERWPSFCEKYTEELKANSEAISRLMERYQGNTVTFVYAARDELHNSAVVLKAFLENMS